MKSSALYLKLEKDFIKPKITDDWIKYMKNHAFLSDNFKKRSMGVVCDNSSEIKKVFTAVFPTNGVLKFVLKTQDSLLFLHHPETWDITKESIFQEMDEKLLAKLKQNRISIYNLHSALDNFGPYATSKTCSDALRIIDQKPFSPYFGGLAGVHGRTKFKTVKELKEKFKKAVGHKVSLYNYGTNEIRDNKVALVAGGGLDIDVLKDVKDLGINTFVTGVAAITSRSQTVHDFAKANGINILGGTHYSTEKFACMQMCKYFRKLNIPSKFIPGKPGFKDL